MRIGIMQPYFFPYLGYFSLIKQTDLFVLLDEVQYIRHGWINRNRILKPGEGWQYIVVPLKKHSLDTLVKNIEINETIEWENKILSQLQHYKKRAPNFDSVINLLKHCFSESKKCEITELNKICLEKTCEYLEIQSDIRVFSEGDIVLPEINAPDEWALYISKAFGADEYINPPSGKSIFDKQKYQENSIKLSFLEVEIGQYNQKRIGFEPALSMIDVMMFNSVSEINMMLDNFNYS